MANNRELSQFANTVGYNGGSIGIGTNNPGAKLEVRDSSSQGIIIRSDSTQSTDTNKALRVRNNSDTNTFHVSHKGQGYFAGDVGIGTDNPTQKLEINNITGGASLLIRTSPSASGGNLLFGDDASDTSGRVGYVHSSNYMFFSTNGGEAVRIDSSGNLNIVSSTSSLTDLNFTASDLSVYARVEGGKSGSGVGDLRFHTYSGGLSEAARITSAGRVGINSTSPATALDIQSTKSSDGLTITKAGTRSAFLGHNGSGDEGLLTLKEGGTTRIQLYAETGQNSYINSGNLGIKVTNPDLTLHVNGVNALPSTSGSTPTGHVTLRAKAQSSSHGMFMGVSNASPWSSWIQAQDVNNNATNYPLLLNPNGGNIGIGTDNPRRHLHLCGGNETTKIQITNATTGSANDGDGFQLSIATDGTAGIEQRENLDLFIATNNTERVRFTNNGKFLKGYSTSRNIYGIHSNFQIEGTDFQSSSLSITCNSTSETPILLLARSRGTSLGSNTALTDGQTIGEISFVPSDGTDMGSASVRLQGVADDNHGSNDVPGRFIIQVVADGSESSSERFRLGHDGRMRVTGVYQETTSGSANVNVQSDGLMQRSISSIKYKKDVETLEDSYADALLELRPVWYRSKCASDNPNHGHWGFVAEELAEIDPRLVIYKNTEISWDENGFAVETSCDPEPEGVQYDRFVPHLLNLIKRQKDTITSQQAQINDLLSRVAALEGS